MNHSSDNNATSDEAVRRAAINLILSPATDSLPPAADGRPHYTLAELKQLAVNRQAGAEAWELPDHLAACPECLAAFEVVIDGIPEVSPAALRAACRLPLPGSARAFAWRLLTPLRIAAALAILLGVGAWLEFHSRQTGLAVSSGALVTADGTRLTAGATLPGRQLLQTATASELILPDGSRLQTAANTGFEFRTLPLGGQTLTLQTGAVECRVTPRSRHAPFVVRTAIGSVQVVGTRFTVTSRAEQTTVFERDGQSAQPSRYEAATTAVTVTVSSGLVRVWNRHQSVEVGPGRQAVLRAGVPLIETMPATTEELKPE